MKYFIIFFVIFFFVKCRDNRAGEFAKYSYCVFGYCNVQNHPITWAGNCFFIKYRDKTFLVSAKHVLTRCHSGTKSEQICLPDTMFVGLKMVNGGGLFKFPIILKPIGDTVQCPLYYREPDVIFYEIKNAEKYSINTVEKYLANNIKDDSIQKEAYVFSLPSPDSLNYHQMLTSESQFSKINLTSTLADGRWMGATGLDYINYGAENITKNLSFGSSGAPVFFKSISGHYLFGGVLCMGTKDMEQIFVAKPDKVLTLLYSKFN